MSVEKANVTARSWPTAKKHKSSKLGYINLNNAERSNFIHEFLKLHNLADDYSPRVHNGLPFKLSWTGSVGGKASAITIDTNHDFELACSALLKKNRSSCQVSVEFDIEDLNGFRISNKWSLPFDEDAEGVELSYGTKVPRLDVYSAHEQLQGEIVLELKKKWTCECHLGEHGEPGHCYVSASGLHLGLNHRKLSLWAAAIAARDATKHEPPNTIDFDGIQDGHMTTVKARGRTGPRATSETNSNDAIALTMAAVMPILASLVPKPTPANPPSTPTRHNGSPQPHTPSRRVHLMSPFSPVLDESMKIHVCLNDFFNAKGIDLWFHESLLTTLDFTPDIIPTIPVIRLCEILDIPEGLGWKFNAFLREWNERLNAKKHAL
ncbi:hypothetical protein BDQ17DRAFT_1249578 [Cyathus striatus]|nr:hypothetical protein BDQ17DRAFT_1249578 [Cyathus striatus]